MSYESTFLDFSLMHPSLPPLPGREEEIVVTGLGMSTPQGGDVQSTWDGLLAGTSGVRLLDAPWAADLPVRLGAPVHEDPGPSLDRVAHRRMDRCQPLAVVAA